MSLPPSREQLERWQKRDCVRCGRHAYVAAWWPDGTTCRTCCDRALRVQGCCPGCGEHRVLPGLTPDRTPICAGCAGFRTSVACVRCGTEGKLHRGRLCSHCSLIDRLTSLLDDGTGQVRPELAPLFDALTTMENPGTGVNWLYNPYVPRFLRGLADGSIPLTHNAFNELEPWRAAAHLRELLMSCELLPVIDKQLLLFERWLPEHLAAINNHYHRRIVKEFATWKVQPWLRARAEHRPLTPSSRRNAGAQIMRATEFLIWLSESDLSLRGCDQAALDRWHASHLGHQRVSSKPFFDWAVSTNRIPQLEIPATPARPGQPLTQHRRLQILRKLLTDNQIELRLRVAFTLLLLYGQPLSRIVRLTIDDVLTTADSVSIRFGEPLTPVPEPFASLVLELIDQRTNMRTATNPNSRWLFPGRGAGQPLRPETLGQQSAKNGVPTISGRTSALRQLVLQAPAPVVADALGIHYTTAHRHRDQAGGTWNRYAPGDHDR
ncbi:hypothetical protein [Nocardia sp. NPDC059239]|uniref:hypothetical protein n=1 Tax=Nocardia sp. NPDC059239 TaxID=3346785 RepID=UPI00367ADE34